MFSPLCSHVCLCLPAHAAASVGLTFLAVGDWGGQTSAPYTEIGQVSTAKGMGIVGESIGSKFVLALGDNFYSSGISTDASDPRFQQTFEDVYTADSLMDTPWCKYQNKLH